MNTNGIPGQNNGDPNKRTDRSGADGDARFYDGRGNGGSGRVTGNGGLPKPGSPVGEPFSTTTHELRGFNFDGDLSYWLKARSNFAKIVAEAKGEHRASDAANGVYEKVPAAYEATLWDLGWTDGRYGQESSDKQLLEAQARLILMERQAQGHAELAALTVEQSAKQAGLEQAEGAYREVKLAPVPRAGSLFLGAVFAVATVILLFADMPISASIVKDGFKFESSAGIGTITSQNNGVPQLALGRQSPSNQANQPVQESSWADWLFEAVIRWGNLLIALGIAVSGVLLKHILDVLLFEEETDNWKSWRKKAIWLAALLIYLYGIYLMGALRFEVKVQELKFGVEADVRQQQPGLVGPAFDAAAQQRLSQLVQDSAPRAFIFLTVLFPLAGGLCFSLAWRTSQDALRKREHQRLVKDMDDERRKARKELNSLIQTIAALTARLERENNDFVVRLTEFYQALYQHGYERGKNVPETLDAGEGLYERCDKALTKLLAKQVRAAAWGTPPKNNFQRRDDDEDFSGDSGRGFTQWVPK